MYIKRLFRFFGGIYFTLFLIAATALFVIAGTFIEARYNSHLFASSFTYSNPLFFLLLLGFFLNILLSSLRRWPFKRRHIPFLLTHLGLLLILSGVMVKNAFGIQGKMTLIEGSGGQEVLLDNTVTLAIEDKKRRYTFDIKKKQLTPPLPTLSITTLSVTPNSQREFSTWIKDDFLVIEGLKPLPLTKTLKPAARVRLFGSDSTPWNIYAVKGDEKLIETLYLQGATLFIRNALSDDLVFKGSLEHALKNGIQLESGKATLHLDLTSPPKLNLTTGDASISLPLSGTDSLLNRVAQKSLHPSLPLTVELTHPPLLLFTIDREKSVLAIGIDAKGRLEQKSYSANQLDTLIAYDNGFLGYRVHWQLPFGNFEVGHREKKAAALHLLSQEIRNSLATHPTLAPPLELLQKSCTQQGEDFVESLLIFFSKWQESGHWLMKESEKLPPHINDILEKIPWYTLSQDEQKTLHWICHLTTQAEKNEMLFIEEISKLFPGNKASTPREKLKLLSETLFSFAPDLPLPPSHASSTQLFSAYCRAFDLHLDTVLPTLSEETLKNFALQTRFAAQVQETITPLDTLSLAQQVHYIQTLPKNSQELGAIQNSYLELQKSLNLTPQTLNAKTLSEAYLNLAPLQKLPLKLPTNWIDQITLETPLTVQQRAILATTAVEENIPLYTFLLEEGKNKEVITFHYDPKNPPLKWPALEGNYLLRLQPKQVKLPFRLRLRSASQKNYPNSNKPYSYGCELLIDGKEEVRLSMNRVFEKEGWRFYLAGITPESPTQVRRAHLVINYDPAKYFFTYPGALILCLGALLLFWGKFK